MILEWGLPMVAVRPEDYQVTNVPGEGISIIGKSAIKIHMGGQGEYHLHFLVAKNTCGA